MQFPYKTIRFKQQQKQSRKNLALNPLARHVLVGRSSAFTFIWIQWFNLEARTLLMESKNYIITFLKVLMPISNICQFFSIEKSSQHRLLICLLIRNVSSIARMCMSKVSGMISFSENSMINMKSKRYKSCFKTCISQDLLKHNKSPFLRIFVVLVWETEDSL